MKAIPLKPLLKTFVFCLLVFLLQALIFFVSFSFRYEGTFGQLLYALFKSLRMNMATAAIFTGPAFLCAVWFAFTHRGAESLTRWLFRLHLVIIVLISFALAADIALFHAWGSKLNGQALDYLRYPKDALSTVFDRTNWIYVGIALAQVLLFGFLLKKWNIQFLASRPRGSRLSVGAFTLLMAGLLLILARGGVKSEVVNRNHVFHSQYSLLNYTALNSMWNLLDLLTQPARPTYRYTFFPDEEAHALVQRIHHASKDSTLPILRTKAPNVILVFLESWGADALECIGGEKGVAPKFGQLASEGLLFDNFYASGTRTEQGLLAVLSGIPARPLGSVIHSFGTFDKLPNLFTTFQQMGYSSSYYYGGRLSFDNVEAYLRSAGVQHVVGIQEVDPVRKTKWGAYDDEVLSLQLKELNEAKTPFFSVLSTLTSHEWFDAEVPVIFRRDADHVNDDYRNTLHYADSCLFKWLQQAKKQPWYDNTLILLVADHACNFPKHRDLHDPERFHIPLLITGGALMPERRGQRLHFPGSQVDIPGTLLAQLGHPAGAFPWSKNLLNEASPHFAWYAFDHGFGYVQKDVKVVYDHNSHKTMSIPEGAKDEPALVREGKAFLQQAAGQKYQ